MTTLENRYPDLTADEVDFLKVLMGESVAISGSRVQRHQEVIPGAHPWLGIGMFPWYVVDVTSVATNGEGHTLVSVKRRNPAKQSRRNDVSIRRTSFLDKYIPMHEDRFAEVSAVIEAQRLRQRVSKQPAFQPDAQDSQADYDALFRHHIALRNDIVSTIDSFNAIITRQNDVLARILDVAARLESAIKKSTENRPAPKFLVPPAEDKPAP